MRKTIVPFRSAFGQHSVSIRSAFGQHQVSIRSAFGQHSVSIKPFFRIGEQTCFFKIKISLVFSLSRFLPRGESWPRSSHVPPPASRCLGPRTRRLRPLPPPPPPPPGLPAPPLPHFRVGVMFEDDFDDDIYAATTSAPRRHTRSGEGGRCRCQGGR